MRPAARLTCCFALIGAFLIENPHCGASPDHYQLSLVYLEKEQFKRALSEARRAIRLDGRAVPPRVVAAMAHMGLGQTAEAVEQLRTALEHEPDNGQIYASLRDVCLQEGRLDLARAVFAEQLARASDNDLARASLGWVLVQEGEEEEGLALLQAAAESPAAGLFARVQMARLYLREERLDEAVETLEAALALEPLNSGLLLTLGECHLLRGEAEAAERRFAAALEHSRVPQRTANAVAQAYYGRGLRRRAIDYYEMALRLGQPSTELLNNLAWAYAEEGIQLERGLKLSLLTLKAEPESVVYLDTYAELYFRSGDYTRALAVIQRAIELEPADGEHYSYLQEQLEKFRQAAVDAGVVPQTML